MAYYGGRVDNSRFKYKDGGLGWAFRASHRVLRRHRCRIYVVHCVLKTAKRPNMADTSEFWDEYYEDLIDDDGKVRRAYLQPA